MNFAPRQDMSRRRYQPPSVTRKLGLSEALHRGGRQALADRQMDMLRPSASNREVDLYLAGDLSLLDLPAVSIVGTRDVSEAGRCRASKLARELCEAGVVVMSGLAKGVDSAAHKAAVAAHGHTIAVIGTPLQKAYPAENAALQEWIYNEHLLVSPFAPGEVTYKASFPKRNRVMAALSDATVIVEASDTSGTLHQAAECGRLGRWLFIMKSVVEDESLSWPSRFLDAPRVNVLEKTKDILDVIIKPDAEKDRR